MEIILSGGGKPEKTKELDKFFLSLLPKKKPLLYIPIAKTTRPFKECYDWFKSIFDALGFKNIEMWTELSDKKLEHLKKFGGIYLGGGDVYYLLNIFRKTGFIDVLKDYIIKERGIVYGHSAGAVILGKDIITASYIDEDKFDIKNTKGLNCINDYGVAVHYKVKHDREIMKLIKEYGFKVIALPEGVGLYIEDHRLSVIGKGKVYLFDKKGKSKLNILKAKFLF
ncbi:MAG: Type 1 glutamine amidotransferase-like domain-containing protein [Candidatus Pacearchaeota archaeon]|nr:Type 1 glutamine amidotransferase-like domain-containing protein [Candidatus Pacearchaeota archaeon]